MKKSYIKSGLVGDENPIDIDCAIFECTIYDALYEKILGVPTGEWMEIAHATVWSTIMAIQPDKGEITYERKTISRDAQQQEYLWAELRRLRLFSSW